MKERIALVTGSAKRLGKAIAVALAKQGFLVAVHYLSSRREALAAAAEIRSLGGKSAVVKGDISKEGNARKIVDAIINKYGRIDVLINNVGNFQVKTIDKVTAADWDNQLKTTVSSTFYMCKAALPYMTKQNYGRVINIGDAGADIIKAWPRITAHMIGKTGILILTKSLAEQYAKYDITVNCVSPGAIEHSTEPPGGVSNMPKGRYANYDDICNAVLFLLRKESSYISGANLKVSGAWMA